MLQHGTVCCKALTDVHRVCRARGICAAVSMLQCVAVCWSALTVGSVLMCCDILQCVCKVLTVCIVSAECEVFPRPSVSCIMLQCVVVCCSALVGRVRQFLAEC